MAEMEVALHQRLAPLHLFASDNTDDFLDASSREEPV
jgi:hypothetical protein